MISPNLTAHGPNAGASYVRTAFSAGVSHLLQSINLPTQAYMAPTGTPGPGAVLEAAAVRWGVPYANRATEVLRASDAAVRVKARNAQLHYPDMDGERVNFFDEVYQVDISAADFDGGAVVAVEICRSDVREYGMGVLEKLATWVELQALNAAGGNSGAPIQLANVATFGPGPNATGDPFPFPFPHNANPARTLSIEYVLKFQNVPMTRGRSPRMCPPLPNVSCIAPANTWKRWADQRYSWGSKYTLNLQALFGGHGVLRMYAIIRLAGLPENLLWNIRLGGRLSGYSQQGGFKGAALADSTIRR